MKPEVIYDMPEAEYHAHPAVGSTMLKVFLHDRREYHERYITQTLKDEESQSQKFGKLLHMLLLEPERWGTDLAPPMPNFHLNEGNKKADGTPSTSKSTKFYKGKVAEFMKLHEGKIIVTEGEREAVETAARNVKLNRFAAELLYHREGCSEVSMFWDDRDTGLRCKARWDWFSDMGADIKTAADPMPVGFRSAVRRFGYHIQAAHYMEAAQMCFENSTHTLFHIAVGNKPPYTCNVYDLSPNYGDGLHVRAIALQGIAQCVKDKDWTNPSEQQVTEVVLDPWSATDQYEINAE